MKDKGQELRWEEEPREDEEEEKKEKSDDLCRVSDPSCEVCQ